MPSSDVMDLALSSSTISPLNAACKRIPTGGFIDIIITAEDQVYSPAGYGA